MLSTKVVLLVSGRIIRHPSEVKARAATIKYNMPGI